MNLINWNLTNICNVLQLEFGFLMIFQLSISLEWKTKILHIYGTISVWSKMQLNNHPLLSIFMFNKIKVIQQNLRKRVPQHIMNLDNRSCKILMECARTLLKKHAKLPDDYWHLSVNCANYLINWWPTKNYIVRFEKFTGNTVSY